MLFDMTLPFQEIYLLLFEEKLLKIVSILSYSFLTLKKPTQALMFIEIALGKITCVVKSMVKFSVLIYLTWQHHLTHWE